MKHNLALFLIPVLIPILVLGSLSVLITQYYIKDEIDQNSRKLLNQTKEKIELMLDGINAVNVNFGLDANVTVNLKRIFNSNTLTFEDVAQLDMLKSLLSGPAYSSDNIDSIYVYFENNNKRFISTQEGMSSFDASNDIDWYNIFLQHRSSEKAWCEVRKIQRYSFEKPNLLLSVFKSIRVIVLNIRMDSIQKSLSDMKTFDNQRLLLLDGQNRLVCDNTGLSSGETIDVSQLFNHQKITSTTVKSNKYDLQFISVIPYEELYKIPINLLMVTSLLLVFSVIQGLILTYFLSKKNYKHISDIIKIIDSAKEGYSLPLLPKQVENEYSYIEYNIIKNFIDQNYLKIQLSEKKYKMKTLELLALQSQINPHFLFNTLETIDMRALGLTGGPNEVSQMLESLATILQCSLTDPMGTISLYDEIENVKSYIDIQRIRFKDKFIVIWNCNLDTKRFQIIKLILQPLIENSIRHGIKHKEGHGTIKIIIRQKTDELTVTVIDNGIGISPEKLVQIKEELHMQQKKHTTHIGLINTNNRLILRYGEAYGLHIRSHFGLGTSVSFSIPCTALLS